MVELLTADYTFVNERLARHYGIPNVYGSHFRRVTLPDDEPARPARAGQHPDGDLVRDADLAGGPRQVAAREHPRRAAAAAAARRAGSARDTAKAGRRPRCASAWSSTGGIRCARAATRGWIRSASRSRTSTRSAGGAPRARRNTPIDASGALPDGTKFDGPAELRQLLLARREEFVTTVTEKLLDLRAGPRRRVLRHAGGPRAFSGTPRPPTTAGRRSF